MKKKPPFVTHIMCSEIGPLWSSGTSWSTSKCANSSPRNQTSGYCVTGRDTHRYTNKEILHACKQNGIKQHSSPKTAQLPVKNCKHCSRWWLFTDPTELQLWQWKLESNCFSCRAHLEASTWVFLNTLGILYSMSRIFGSKSSFSHWDWTSHWFILWARRENAEWR